MQTFRQAPAKLLNKEADLDIDNLRFSLHGSALALNADSMAYVSDLSAELSTGGGYTSGGLAASSQSITSTAANSWTAQRAASTLYAVGTILRPASANGYLYQVSVGGTTGGSLPTYPTVVGASVADGSATLTCVGKGIVVFTAASPSWNPATFTGVRYMVLSDRTPGSAAAQPLLGYYDFGSDQAGSGGAFALTVDPVQGVLQFLVP